MKHEFVSVLALRTICPSVPAGILRLMKTSCCPPFSEKLSRDCVNCATAGMTEASSLLWQLAALRSNASNANPWGKGFIPGVGMSERNDPNNVTSEKK